MPKYYVKKEQFRIVDKEKLALYLNNCERNDTQVVIALVWLTGARISEILELTTDDIIKNDDGITVVIDAKKFGKTGYPTFSYSDPFVSNLVVPYVERQPNGIRMFPLTKRSYQLKLENLNKKIYGDKTQHYITFHYLRHSRITYLTRQLQASPEEIKSWTGHNSTAFEEYFRTRKVERFKGRIE